MICVYKPGHDSNDLPLVIICHSTWINRVWVKSLISPHSSLPCGLYWDSISMDMPGTASYINLNPHIGVQSFKHILIWFSNDTSWVCRPRLLPKPDPDLSMLLPNLLSAIWLVGSSSSSGSRKPAMSWEVSQSGFPWSFYSTHWINMNQCSPHRHIYISITSSVWWPVCSKWPFHIVFHLGSQARDSGGNAYTMHNGKFLNWQ